MVQYGIHNQDTQKADCIPVKITDDRKDVIGLQKHSVKKGVTNRITDYILTEYTLISRSNKSHFIDITLFLSLFAYVWY